MFRSTITIYSDFDPVRYELSALAREAEEGAAICTQYEAVSCDDERLPDDVLSFFGEIA